MLIAESIVSFSIQMPIVREWPRPVLLAPGGRGSSGSWRNGLSRDSVFNVIRL